MEEVKENNKVNKKIILSLILMIILLIGGSYAWLRVVVDGTKKNVLIAGSLSLVLGDNTASGINIEKAVPVTDATGKQGTEYTFSLKNGGTVDSDYTIYLDDEEIADSETRMPDSSVRYYLEKNDVEVTTTYLSSTGINPNRILETGTLKKNQTNQYVLKIWIDQNATNEIMDNILKTKLRVVAEQHQRKDYSISQINKSQPISKIVFEDAINKPENTAFEYDLTVEQNEGIMQYNVLNNDNITYTAYIQSDGIIKAPEHIDGFFAGMTNLVDIENLSKLNTSNVSTMSALFQGDNNLTSINLSNNNLSNVTVLDAAFIGTTNLNSLKMNNSDLSNVVSMNQTFVNSGLTSIDFNKANLSKLTALNQTFSSMNYLETVSFKGANLSKLTTLSKPFTNCNNLKSVNFESSNLSSLGYFDPNNFFDEKSNIETLNFKRTNFSSYNGMFAFPNLPKLTSINLEGADFSSLDSFDQFLVGSDPTYVDYTMGLKDVNMKNMKTKSINNVSNMLSYQTSLETVNFEGINFASGASGVMFLNTNDTFTITVSNESTRQILLNTFTEYSHPAKNIVVAQ